MESFNRKYELLFSIQVTHPLFKNKLCDYLTMQPDERTTSLFSNRNLIAKSKPGELKIITQVSEIIKDKQVSVVPFFNQPDDQQYCFLLRLNDAELFNTTKLDYSNFPAQAFYFFREADATTLSVKKCMVFDKFVFKSYGKENMPSEVRILNQDKKEIHKEQIDVKTGVFKYEMIDYRSGFYTIVTQNAKMAKPKEESFYFNPLARRQNIFGIVQIPSAIKLSKGKEEKNTFIIALNN